MFSEKLHTLLDTSKYFFSNIVFELSMDFDILIAKGIKDMWISLKGLDLIFYSTALYCCIWNQ